MLPCTSQINQRNLHLLRALGAGELITVWPQRSPAFRPSKPDYRCSAVLGTGIFIRYLSYTLFRFYLIQHVAQCKLLSPNSADTAGTKLGIHIVLSDNA